MTNEFDDRFAERHHEVSSTKIAIGIAIIPKGHPERSSIEDCHHLWCHPALLVKII
jgi:hypothetical protein